MVSSACILTNDLRMFLVSLLRKWVGSMKVPFGMRSLIIDIGGERIKEGHQFQLTPRGYVLKKTMFYASICYRRILENQVDFCQRHMENVIIFLSPNFNL